MPSGTRVLQTRITGFLTGLTHIHMLYAYRVQLVHYEPALKTAGYINATFNTLGYIKSEIFIMYVPFLARIAIEVFRHFCLYF